MPRSLFSPLACAALVSPAKIENPAGRKSSAKPRRDRPCRLQEKVILTETAG